MSKMRRLRRLYNRLPPVEKKCPSGCTACCGPVPFSVPEFELAVEVSGELPRVEGPDQLHLKCQYSTPEGCKIYEVRPFLCRVYGLSEVLGLFCPHGYRTHAPLSTEAGAALVAEYIEFTKQTGNVVLPIGATDLFKEYQSKGIPCHLLREPSRKIRDTGSLRNLQLMTAAMAGAMYAPGRYTDLWP